MAEQQQESEGHPVLAGLLALLGVGLAVGLLVSGAALAGTSVLGVGEGEDTGQASSDQSVYVPKPSPTPENSDPAITLAPKPSSTGGSSESEGEPEPEDAISLSAAATEVAPGDPIDLSGVYPGHEGATLVVQRFEDGEWVDFADGDVTTTVSDETFSTYVITSRSELSRWRMRDSQTDDVSNEVRVQIG
jgi:hypothetical protein